MEMRSCPSKCVAVYMQIVAADRKRQNLGCMWPREALRELVSNSFPVGKTAVQMQSTTTKSQSKEEEVEDEPAPPAEGDAQYGGDREPNGQFMAKYVNAFDDEERKTSFLGPEDRDDTGTLESRSLTIIIGQSGRGGTNGSVGIWKGFSH